MSKPLYGLKLIRPFPITKETTMKSKIGFFALLPVALFSLIMSCEAPLSPFPSFKPINVDENTIFLTSRWDDNCHKIIAFDTKTETAIYTYKFPESIICDFFYDKSFDESVYFLTVNGSIARLNPLTGKVQELHFELSRVAECFTYVNNELWIAPCVPGFKDVPVTYAVYNAQTRKIRYETLPGGEMYLTKFAGHNGNNVYVSLLYSLGYSDIYNLTQKKFVDLSCFDKDYLYLDFYDPYLLGTFVVSENNGERERRDVDLFRYSVIDNVLNVEKVFSTGGFFSVNSLYQNDDFITLLTNKAIITFDKSGVEKDRVSIKTKDTDSARHGDNIYIIQAWTDKVYKYDMINLTCSLI